MVLLDDHEDVVVPGHTECDPAVAAREPSANIW
jgi:hypothetical protein